MASKSPVGLEDRFEDLDDKDVYARVKAEAASDKAANFVVEFNFQEARIAFNLRPEDFGVLLGQKAPEGTQIGNRYGFSRRIQAIMMAPPLPSLPKPGKKQLSKQNDIESVSTCNENKAQPSARATSQSSEDLEIYQMIKETVNYTSIDRGKQCRHNEEPPRVLPPWHWSWLTLCSDSIVVSFHETPPTEQPERDGWAEEELRSMRSTTLSVLSQLSRHGLTDFSHRLVSFKRVRQAMTETEPQSDTAYEGSSNLVYYLFEDYSSVMSVLEASKLRPEQLRRERPCCFVMPSGGKDTDFDFYGTEEAKPRRTISSSLCTKSLHGEVNIPLSARSRFERLGDRLQLLMLNTIQGCLEEQKALSDTYFSLTAQRDSQATARLSRSATLLAKLSVFFLPINFMTSYFSLEIPDLVEHYTPKTYWICFAVIAGLSFISLFFFSRMLEVVSDTLEGWSDYVSRKASNLVGCNTHDDINEQ
ncbi:ADP-ribosylation factor [Colletotrichum graminicola M1.001]|uniref:ADP-ribosylation factor n=1 Tax=Colletotrichum graminicola (strain M1.001 / M2 / FGSC 10212) TaxID=645133 RepID=E3QDJ5_COLGM|nr:ADP-ribosylation factor [Colletotrichum graminicola M1.001]EFQ28700.1 ADP-ribosylation factor [Colletotrichum graminicola M1.001]